MSRKLTIELLVLAGLATVATAAAAETITYGYDAKGRLTVACRLKATADRIGYTFDKADNRTKLESSSPDYTLLGGQSISSPDGRFSFVMQTDGNLVLYQNGVAALWASSTVGSGDHVRMQFDGNLVVYSSVNAAVWNSQTHGNTCATLRVQNDGNVVITSITGSQLWSTNTGGH